MSASVSDTSTRPLFEKSHRPYLLRKLHSLCGVLPVGAFMMFHLWQNARAIQGQQEFDEAVSGINHLRFLPALEWGLIMLPLLFHAGYGVKLAFDGKPNVRAYAYSGNWMYTLQRVTGLLAFLFIGFHLYEYWGQKLAGKMAPEQFYPALCQNMSATVGPVPVVGLVYAVRHRGVRLPLRERALGLLLLVGRHRLAPLATALGHRVRGAGPRGARDGALDRDVLRHRLALPRADLRRGRARRRPHVRRPPRRARRAGWAGALP